MRSRSGGARPASTRAFPGGGKAEGGLAGEKPPPRRQSGTRRPPVRRPLIPPTPQNNELQAPKPSSVMETLAQQSKVAQAKIRASAPVHERARPEASHQQHRSVLDQCMMRILSNLPPEDLMQASQCCSRWNKLSSHVWARVECTDLVVDTTRGEGWVRFVLKRCPAIRRVRVHVEEGATASDEVLDAIAGCSRLRDVCITVSPAAREVSFSSSGLARMVSSCPELRRVALQGCSALKELRFQSKSLESLAVAHAEALRSVELRCPQLQELSVHAAPLVPAAGSAMLREHEHAIARQIAECCPSLARLHLAVPGMTDSGVSALLSSTPQGLTSLCITGAPAITDDAVAKITERCPALQLVDLSGCAGVTDASLKALAKAYGRMLTHLLMASCPHITCAGVNDAVAQMPRLQLLDIGMSIRQEQQQDGAQEQTTPRRVALKRKASAPAANGGTKRTRRSLASAGLASDAADAEGVLVLRLTRLQRVSLWGCDGLRGLHIEGPSLIDLNLNQCSQLEGSAMSLDCPGLTALSAAECPPSAVDALSEHCRLLPVTAMLYR